MHNVHINLDFLVIPEFGYFLHHYEDPFPEEKLFQYLRSLELQDNTVISIQAVHEAYPLDNFFPWLNLTIEQIKKIAHCKIVLILNSSVKEDFERYKTSSYIDTCIIDFIFIDYFAMKVRHTFNFSNYEYNQKWNSQQNKALFLIGKPQKIHRIGLLYQYFKMNMLDYIEWSLYMPDYLADKSRPFIIENIDNTEYNKFISSVTRQLDDISHSHNKDWGFHYSGLPFDFSLYQNTALSIISETMLDTHTGFLTEKTYRAIANNHPFIFVGSESSLKALENNGFKTFTNYMEIPNYASITDTVEKLQSVVTNTKYFLDQCNNEDFYNQVNDDIQHNFYRLEEFVNENKKSLGRFETELVYVDC